MNACRSPGGTVSGVWLTRTGVDQVRPPSWDIAKATSVYWRVLNRASSQTAYRFPVDGSTATSGRNMGARTPAPPSGLATPRAPGTVKVSIRGTISAATMGFFAGSQVWPLSVERTSARLKSPWSTPLWSLFTRIWQKTFTRVPSGRATTSWPWLKLPLPGSAILRAGSQVWPPSMVRENIVV
jgi:hypothetical protein